jgi:glycosyltransferase involved in cell wall biosynthesis
MGDTIRSQLVVLAFASYYLPGYKAGGPIQSLANLVSQLNKEVTFRIVSADRDLGDTAAYPDILPGQWRTAGNAQVFYLAPGQCKLGTISRILSKTPHDVLFLNSLFDPKFTTLPLLAQHLNLAPRRPVLLAPRGELSSGAPNLKALKKRSFMALTRLAKLYRHVHWIASTGQEARDIRNEFAEASISIAANLPSANWTTFRRSPRRQGDQLRIVFLSRISPMKNLDFALRVLREVRVPILFDIFGPKEDPHYWEHCSTLAAQMPKHVTVSYRGSIKPPEAIETISRYDLFFLPTRGENFGHVIAEAILGGTRLLISDQTPWRGLAGSGVGHDLPLKDTNEFVRVIEKEYRGFTDHETVLARNVAFMTTNYDFTKEREAFLEVLMDQVKSGQSAGE